MLEIFPILDLKNLFEDAFGNFFLNIVYDARNIPWTTPQIIKFQDAPCQIPITAMEINKLITTKIPGLLKAIRKLNGKYK